LKRHNGGHQPISGSGHERKEWHQRQRRQSGGSVMGGERKKAAGISRRKRINISLREARQQAWRKAAKSGNHRISKA